MRAEFEEKTFEAAFNSEFKRVYGCVYAFGQVQEGSIGADSAAFMPENYFRISPFHLFPFLGGILLPEVVEIMEHWLNRKLAKTYNMATNILFQYKRPELLTKKNSNEWKYWGKSYFRYEIYKEQQQLLEHLSKALSGKALVLYASPAFVKMDDLQTADRDRTIINSTNFCEASKLSNHHVNTYVQKGKHSIACSEPEHIKHISLSERLENSEYFSLNAESIISFANTLHQTVTEDPTYGSYYQHLLSPYETLSEFPLSYSILKIQLFSRVTGVQWLPALKNSN